MGDKNKRGLHMKKLRGLIEEKLNDNCTFADEYNAIEKILSEYISDKDFLRYFRSTGDGINIALNINIIKGNPFDLSVFENCFFDISALCANANFLSVFEGEFANIINSDNLKWSRESPNEKLDKTDDVYGMTTTIFDELKILIESRLKPLINILYCAKIETLKIKDQSRTLGDKVTLLAKYYNFFSYKGILLSQWRNISAHEDYKILNNKIICTYAQCKTYIFDKEEDLIDLYNNFARIFNAMHTSVILFLYNNYFNLSIQDIEIRDEVWLDSLKVALGSQNFLIDNFENSDIFEVFIMDKTNTGTLDCSKRTNRIIHCSQFSLAFWPFVKKSIRINYLDTNEKIHASIFYENKLFIEMNENNFNSSYIAKNMVFEFINKN